MRDESAESDKGFERLGILKRRYADGAVRNGARDDLACRDLALLAIQCAWDSVDDDGIGRAHA